MAVVTFSGILILSYFTKKELFNMLEDEEDEKETNEIPKPPSSQLQYKAG